MYLYLPFQERIYSDEIGEYISFGIKAISRAGKEFLAVSDVSTDKIFVIDLCIKFTKGNLSPLHLVDVIEDSI